MLDAIKGIVGAVAPNLGAALGGPIGGAAMTMLSQALGCENNERALQRAVQAATPEQLAEIKKAELDFEARMKELDVDIFALRDARHTRRQKALCKRLDCQDNRTGDGRILLLVHCNDYSNAA
jgi:hypothetical protein